MESFNQNVIRHKTGLLNLAAELGNISKACRVMGVSRDTFYRYQAGREAGGVEALFDVNRRRPNLKKRVDALAFDASVVSESTSATTVDSNGLPRSPFQGIAVGIRKARKLANGYHNSLRSNG